MHSDATTFDLGQTRLRLKDGLAFSAQQGRRQTWYLIEDESRNQFYRIGPAEYAFLSMLDGNTTLSTALATTCSVAGSDAFSENDAIQFCRWLIDVELAQNESTIQTTRNIQKRKQKDSNSHLQKLNLVSIRIPVADLDGIANFVGRYTRWLVSWPVAVVWFFVCAVAVMLFAVNSYKLETIQVFSRDNRTWFVVTWMGLKLVHEIAHVVTCKILGGKIGKGGVLFLLMIPMPYVDVTSCWRFSSKQKRMLVSAAGMIAEMFVAAIATIVWCNTGPGQVNFQAANIMLAASLHTLLFNANPLMKFDGYYIVADWLELPNLGNHGQRFVNGLGRRYFLGLPAARLPYVGSAAWIIRIYGVFALIWKILICVGLMIGAANLFPGFGVVMALIGLTLWGGLPLVRLLKFVFKGSETESPSGLRFVCTICAIVSVTYLMGRVVPAPTVVSAPVVIDYQDKEVVRAKSSGFVKKILVQERQTVDAGELLVVLENPELESRETKLELELLKAQIQSRSLQNAESIGALQAQNELIKSLEDQVAEIRQLKENLFVRAQSNGMILSRNLDSLIGQYCDAGMELMQIGDSAKKEVVALISQDDSNAFNQISTNLGDVSVFGFEEEISAHIDDVAPRAVDVLPHFAFSGTFGGPIDVVERSAVEDNHSSLNNHQLKMLVPAVPIRLKLSEGISHQLQSGQTGMLHLRCRTDSLGQYLATKVGKWFQNNISHSHGL